MSRVYYGTSIDEGLRIAYRGAILSPLQVEIELLHGLSANGQASKLAYKLLCDNKKSVHSHFNDITVCLSIDRARHQSMSIIDNAFFDNYLILGFDVDEDKFSRFRKNSEEETRLVKSILPLDALTETYYNDTPRNSELMQLAFGKFNPKYLKTNE